METQLRKLQLTQLEILKKIDVICGENNIRYSLYAGTLLGAVRHGGFIPWDDDLDICMPRTDYNRFLEVWSRIQPEGYVLQTKENTPSCSPSFAKVRKDGTTFWQSGEKPGIYHMGIFVDIFPIDRIPNGTIKRIIFYWRWMKYQLYTREYIPAKSSVIVRLVSTIMLRFTSHEERMRYREHLISKLTCYNDDTRLKTVGIETVKSLRVQYPSDMFDRYTKIKFEDSEFMCMDNWNSCLQYMYGDYMELPAEEDRVQKHQPIIVDFEHNYEELEGL